MRLSQTMMGGDREAGLRGPIGSGGIQFGIGVTQSASSEPTRLVSKDDLLFSVKNG